MIVLRVCLPMVGAHRRMNHDQKRPQDSVGIEAGNRVDCVVDLGSERSPFRLDSGGFTAIDRVETIVEEFDEFGRDLRVGVERLHNIVRAIGAADLRRIAGVGPQDAHVAPSQSCSHHEPCQGITLGSAIPHREHGVAHPLTVVAVEFSRHAHTNVINKQ